MVARKRKPDPNSRSRRGDRPLFDPASAAGAPSLPTPTSGTGVPPVSPQPPSTSPISVTTLAALIESALAKNLPDRLRIIGEISNLKHQTHYYFNLKDPAAGDDSKHGAVINCVMFASSGGFGGGGRAALGFTPADGQRVIATGRISFFARQGRTQLYVDSIEPVGLGSLEQRFRALSAELKSLGYFDPERKRPLPVFSRRVAIVTSRTGAALHDVLNTMRRRCPAVEPALIDVRVQGDDAAPSIVRALDWLSREHESLGIDAIILTRGGGSIEDLWAFNERPVADAILRCAVPIVAAIGHETDTTIAELVADLRCATPTQAAMVLTPDRDALSEELDHRRARLINGVLRVLEREQFRLRAAARNPLLADPLSIVRHAAARLDSLAAALHGTSRHTLSARRAALEQLSARLSRHRPEAASAARRIRLHDLSTRLRRAMHDRVRAINLPHLESQLTHAANHALESRRAELNAFERELTIAGPASVLARGYSVTTTASGEVIRATNQAPPGTRITTRLADGTLNSEVMTNADTAPTARSPITPPRAPLPPRASRTKSLRKPDRDQLGLFHE